MLGGKFRKEKKKKYTEEELEQFRHDLKNQLNLIHGHLQIAKFVKHKEEKNQSAKH